jgi:hypothetical protein
VLFAQVVKDFLNPDGAGLDADTLFCSAWFDQWGLGTGKFGEAAGMPERGDQIRQLAYHLYTLCERKKWADDARAYNEPIAAWHGIVTASPRDRPSRRPSGMHRSSAPRARSPVTRAISIK